MQLRNNAMVRLLLELAPNVEELDRDQAIHDYRMNMPAVDVGPPPALNRQHLLVDLEYLARDLERVRSDLELSMQALQDELDDPWPAPPAPSSPPQSRI
eukprot:354787-Pleurochrysis_carterae.AAC.1